MKITRGPVPPHIIKEYGSARQWKALKRRQLKAAWSAIEELQKGCAFFPCGAEPVSRAQKALRETYDAIKLRSWGR